MDYIFGMNTGKTGFEAQVTAALMIQSNALIPIKLASKICGISRQEINRRIARGTFPKPRKLSKRDNAIRKAFHIQDLLDWIQNPKEYLQNNLH